MPTYDHVTHKRLTKTKQIQPKPVVTEGILSMSIKKLRYVDLTIFVDTPLDIYFIRRRKRYKRKRQNRGICY